MKRFAVIAALLLSAVGVTNAQNMIATNGGFDATGTVTVDFSSADTIDGATVPGWRLIGFGTTYGAQGDYQILAEASAPSQPNVFQINFTAGDPGYAWVDMAGVQSVTTLDPAAIYRFSYYARKVGAAAATARVQLQFPGATPAQVATEFITPSDSWQKYSFPFRTPADYTECYPEIAPWGASTSVVQYDSFAIEDATRDILIINGDFEDSSTSALGWLLWNSPQNDFTAGIVTSGADHGNNAIRIAQSAAGGHDFATENPEYDGALYTPQLPFIGGHQMYLAYSIKAGTANSVAVRCVAYDAAGGVAAIFHDKVEGAGANWLRHAYEYAIPAEAVGYRVNFRMVDSAGLYVNGDAFIDNVVIGDLTAGGVPVELSGFSIE